MIAPRPAPIAPKLQNLTPPPTDRLGGTPLRQTLVGLLAFVAGFTGYFAVQWATAPRFRFEGAWDHAIPFVPWALPVYDVFIPYAAWTFWRVDRARFLTVMRAAALACVVSFACFAAFPAAVSPPDLDRVPQALRWAFELTLRVDGRHNTCPSLHVSITLLCAIGVRRVVPWVFSLGAGAVIIAATLLVKQHAVADVAGGTLLGVLCWVVAARHAPASSTVSRV